MPLNGKKLSDIYNEMLEFFGPNGERWGKNYLFSKIGRYGLTHFMTPAQALRSKHEVQRCCLLGGMVMVVGIDRDPYRAAVYEEARRYMAECVPQDFHDDPDMKDLSDIIASFNDDEAISYAEIRELLICAKNAAIARGD